jgi:hypothetical protein
MSYNRTEKNSFEMKARHALLHDRLAHIKHGKMTRKGTIFCRSDASFIMFYNS